jgi:3-oxoacyl-[acyl-carrier-protein] synthase II
MSKMLSHPLTATSDRLVESLGVPIVRGRTLASACSSGANALIVAAGWLLAGEVDAVVAGASDGLCRLTFSGFNALAAVDPEPCRPFDRSRRGLSLGEGAGFLVLERADHAERRGARPIAELAGWAMGAEAHHITHPEPSGRAAGDLLSRAIAEAKLDAASIDYVNAHGTGTPHNDAMEAKALGLALGREIARVPVSSSKGQLGHTLGAAGAIEAVITTLAIDRQVVPPTAGLADPDPECAALVHVMKEGRSARVRAAVSSSFGFGGMDGVLVLTEPGLAREHAPGARRIVVTGTYALAPPSGQIRIAENFAQNLDRERARRLDRASRIGTFVAERSLVAAFADKTRPERTGVVFGSAFGNIDASAAFMHRLTEKGPRFVSPAEFPNLVPSSPSGHASIYLGLRGAVLAVAELAASGESAFAQAAELVAEGAADAMVAGAIEEYSDIVEHALVGLFSPPSQAGPSGDARGPGGGGRRTEIAAALVVETEEAARARGAKMLARVEDTRAWVAFGRSSPEITGVRAPRPGAIAVVAREDARACELLRKAGWSTVPRVSCVERFGENEGLGAAALCVATERVARGEATEALVVGESRGTGFAFLLAGRE